MTQPKLITKPFADDALPGYVNEIPKENPTGAPEQNASWSVGFPPITMTAIDDGGLPPNGEDMNGVLRAITEHNLFVGGGGVYEFTSDYITEVGGYSKGAVLVSDDKTALWMSIQDNNTQNFNGATKTQWRRIAFTELDSTLASIQSALNTKADKSVTITAGDGLTGGGTLAGNRVFAVNGSVVRTDRTINAGTGLSGGGNLSANRTLSVNYGTTAGTAAQGNDVRITGATQKSANLSDLANAGAARQNLGLGTAATRNVGSSAGDVLEFGAFGVGAGSTPSLQSAPQGAGFYASGGAVIDGEFYIPADSLLIRFTGGAGRYFGCKTPGGNMVFFKDYNGKEVYLIHEGNLLGSTGSSTVRPMTQKAVTDSLLGVGQKWVNMTSSRSSGVTYTNSLSKPIQVAINLEDGGNGTASLWVDDVEVVDEWNNNHPEIPRTVITVIIPSLSKYRLVTTDQLKLRRWMELR